MQNAPPAPVPSNPQANSVLAATVNGQQVIVSSAEGDALRQAQAAAPGNPLDTMNVPQAFAWIDANVIDVNSTKAVLKAVTALLIIQRADLQRTQTAPSLSPVNLNQPQS